MGRSPDALRRKRAYGERRVGYNALGDPAPRSLAFAARHPERLRSLALIEPAWAGNEGLDPTEAAVRRELDRIMALPPHRTEPERLAASLRAPWARADASLSAAR